ncbi:MAG TPA: ABC transporter ATP-binding protein [Nitrososphaerales archaeon]|jgi:energy-coupling factor transport system ATP-binding protein|nr:ABC transporter ATP-binding protein [Nitrososphaerales archaeon]|tara:strand:+ start:76 stop:891 length:816 start_codon:yes stop_codon:yes gene_type:complete
MIEFSSVEYRHPNGVLALRNIDLKIRKGEVLAIVGENGAGKTTLIKHTNGLLKPSKGKVTAFDMDTNDESVANLSRKIGIIFQNPDHQIFSESVENEVKFALKNFGFKEEAISERLEWALNFFDLERYRTTSPMLLSGGEKKRLCIASVLAWDPDVVVMDEPTVGQDFIQKERLTKIIQMLVSKGKTVVIVAHDIEFIWPLQPRVIVMCGGKIIADNKAGKIFQERELLDKARIVKPQLQELSEKIHGESSGAFSNIYDAKQWIISKLKSD